MSDKVWHYTCYVETIVTWLNKHILFTLLSFDRSRDIQGVPRLIADVDLELETNG